MRLGALFALLRAERAWHARFLRLLVRLSHEQPLALASVYFLLSPRSASPTRRLGCWPLAVETQVHLSSSIRLLNACGWFRACLQCFEPLRGLRRDAEVQVDEVALAHGHSAARAGILAWCLIRQELEDLSQRPRFVAIMCKRVYGL